MSTNKNDKTGVLLMTYGSATTAENVRSYFEHIYGNKVSEAGIADFENRYRLVGGSALVAITQRQAKLLERSLGNHFIVHAGMRHSEPFIADAIARLKSAGAQRLIGLILAPQFSSVIMDGYRKDFTAGAHRSDFADTNITLIKEWPDEPLFIALLAERIKEKLQELKAQYHCNIPVVFTTHSLPQKVVDSDPGYMQQLQKTTNAILALLAPDTIHFSVYQSAGHTPEKWLKPDITDILLQLHQKNTPAILIAPIQFLCDHLEVQYDLDTAARQQCKDRGIAYSRIELPNTDPVFIKALHSLVIKNST